MGDVSSSGSSAGSARSAARGGVVTVAARADLAIVARGGALNLVGVLTNSVASFVLVLVVTRGLGATANGIFFESVALFSLLGAVAHWGSEVGVVRTIPRFRVLGRTADIRHSIRAGVGPVVAIGGVLAVGMVVFAEPLGRLLTNGRHGADMAPVVRALAPFLPLAAAFTVALAATRGFGTMVPSVVIDKVGRAIAQPLLAFAVIALGMSSVALAMAWAAPMAIGLVAIWIWMVVLLRRWEGDHLEGPEQARGARHTFMEFWRFTAPRGLAGVFATAILWLDTLLLGSLRSPAEAGIYAAATRYLAVGQFIGVAISQVVGPKLSELLAPTERDRSRLRQVFATSTAWLMLLSWPLYLTMIVMAPSLLAVFGERYVVAERVLMILGGAMLVATAVGPVDIVLLMSGKSLWNLLNTTVAVASNVVLNLLLIPHLGITGAAIAWAVSILLNNLLPLLQVWRVAGVLPFEKGSAIAALCAGLSFGLVGLTAHLALPANLLSLAIVALVATPIYLVLLWRFRQPLALFALRDAMRRGDRRHSGMADSEAVLHASDHRDPSG